MEVVLMRAAVADPTWLAPHDEAALRWALSLARISAVTVHASEGTPAVVEIDHATNAYRAALHHMLERCVDADKVLSRDGVRAQIPAIRSLVADERASLLSLFGNRIPAQALDRCTRRRPLALALGGGGGTGYVYVGAMDILEEAGITPSLIAGTSMGAIVAAFRCKQRDYSLVGIRQLLQRLSWKKLFRLFDTDSRFGLPATLKLFLREMIGHEFEKRDDGAVAGQRGGHFMRMSEMEIPLRVTIAGLVHGPGEKNVDRYAHLLDDAVTDVRALRSRAGNIARALQEMSRQPVRPIYVGGDELTKDFDVLDAIGFSSAVPGIIHYDILRDDPRMVALVTEMMKREGVFRLVDGGLADNLPAREAWRSVQAGACGDRDPFVLAMDAFAPQLTRNVLFLPLMRIAAANSVAGRAVAHTTISFKKVLSPLTVVPSPQEFMRAVDNGRSETEPHVPFIRKMVGPIPDPPGVVTELA
ncbi:MAG TPA: patatin-like phospholipase family protein [Myxococcota bacterium]